MSLVRMSKGYLNESLILYLLKQLGTKSEGKKKLMKLMFLLDHYDIDTKRLSPSSQLGNNFEIYYYGVFSTDVMVTISRLMSENKIIDGYPLKLKEGVQSDLDIKTLERVDYILEKFGNLTGYQLEVGTLHMLGIEPSEKRNYFGKSVKEIISSRK